MPDPHATPHRAASLDGLLPPVIFYVCLCCSNHAGVDEGSRLVPNDWAQCRECGYRCSCYGCIAERSEPE